MNYSILSKFSMVFSTTALISLFSVVSAHGEDMAQNGILVHEASRSFTVTTPRLEATFKDGIMIGLKNLATGEVHSSAKLDDIDIPVGVGHLRNDPKIMTKLHVPWGSQSLGQALAPGTTPSCMHRPHEASEFTYEIDSGCITAIWRGLTNGEDFYPDDDLVLEARVDEPTGRLLYRASGRSAEAGIFGIQAPIANLHPDHRFYVASFGGTMFDSNKAPALITLGHAPFFEAPVIGIEGRKGSVGLWTEDEKMHPKFFFMNWSGNSFSLAIEHLNLMPFEPHTTVNSVTWHVDVFDGGWTDAMTPYRQWYHEHFAKEIQQKRSVKWADKIRVITDRFGHSDEILKRVATLFDPETVMYHEWNARAARFDTELPDWTPRNGYPERVERLQSYGFRTMAYVNTYCVNYGSPVFKKDNIKDFALTRKYRRYDWYLREPQTWDNIDAGRIVYTDPLSAGWRRYHTDNMIQWREDTGTDANYEDVGGTTGDFGNGTIDDVFGAQGGREQFKELLRRNPSVPMASEYGPESIAFAVRWPLVYVQLWGNRAVRKFWMRNQRPVSSFIYGHRPWVPMINADTDFLMNVVAACSDALGGLAQFEAHPHVLDSEQGMGAHMVRRARFFAENQLIPYFTREMQNPELVGMYEDRSGGVYKYFVNDEVQRMTGPDGKDVYIRVTGLNRLDTELFTSGWPGRDGKRIIGLNPDVSYAFDSLQKSEKSGMLVSSLPEDIMISRYYETEDFTVLALEKASDEAPSEGTVKFVFNREYHSANINGKFVDLSEWRGEDGRCEIATEFPSHMLFIKNVGRVEDFGKPFCDGTGYARFVLTSSGIERGGQYKIPHRRNFDVPLEDSRVRFFFMNHGGDADVTRDYLMQVPSKETSVRIYARNTQRRHGDGTIARVYLNGEEVGLHDFKVSDDSLQSWTLPVGRFHGGSVLITIATDQKKNRNADEQWWASPRFIIDPEQVFRNKTL